MEPQDTRQEPQQFAALRPIPLLVKIAGTVEQLRVERDIANQRYSGLMKALETRLGRDVRYDSHQQLIDRVTVPVDHKDHVVRCPRCSRPDTTIMAVAQGHTWFTCDACHLRFSADTPI